jgi:hypothetical protein
MLSFRANPKHPSPPSIKLASYLRWKRLPFLWRSTAGTDLSKIWDAPRFSHIEERLMPLLVFPDGRSMLDSTFLFKLRAAGMGRSMLDSTFLFKLRAAGMPYHPKHWISVTAPVDPFFINCLIPL